MTPEQLKHTLASHSEAERRQSTIRAVVVVSLLIAAAVAVFVFRSYREREYWNAMTTPAYNDR